MNRHPCGSIAAAEEVQRCPFTRAKIDSEECPTRLRTIKFRLLITLEERLSIWFKCEANRPA